MWPMPMDGDAGDEEVCVGRIEQEQEDVGCINNNTGTKPAAKKMGSPRIELGTFRSSV